MSSRQPTLFNAEPDPWQFDAGQEKLGATVVFAEQPHGPYFYSIPPALAAKLKPGQRVQVPLGKGNRPIAGYCTAVAMKPVSTRPLKPVARIVDELPLLSPAMLRLAGWMADYYLCPLGQVLQAIVPAGGRGEAGNPGVTFLTVPPAPPQSP